MQICGGMKDRGARLRVETRGGGGGGKGESVGMASDVNPIWATSRGGGCSISFISPY